MGNISSSSDLWPYLLCKWQQQLVERNWNCACLSDYTLVSDLTGEGVESMSTQALVRTDQFSTSFPDKTFAGSPCNALPRFRTPIDCQLPLYPVDNIRLPWASCHLCALCTLLTASFFPFRKLPQFYIKMGVVGRQNVGSVPQPANSVRNLFLIIIISFWSEGQGHW